MVGPTSASAHPDESGSFRVGKVFGGRFCVQVPICTLAAGDFIEFYRDGMRVRRVVEVHRGRKHNYATFERLLANPFRSQKVNLKDIRSAWRAHD